MNNNLSQKELNVRHYFEKFIEGFSKNSIVFNIGYRLALCRLRNKYKN